MSDYLQGSLTYAEVGATRNGSVPGGYRVLHQADVVGQGVRAFGVLARSLLSWGLQRAIDLRVSASSPEVQPGATVVGALAVGPVYVLVPCRVVYRVQAPRTVGFAYGSLPGHPLVGEERFTAELTDQDEVLLRILSFSRPAGTARLAGRLTRAAQAEINRRYAAAGVRLATGRQGSS